MNGCTSPALSVLVTSVLLTLAHASLPWPTPTGPLGTGQAPRGCPANGGFAYQFQTPKQENAPGGTTMAADATSLYFYFDNSSATATVDSNGLSNPTVLALNLDSGELQWRWVPEDGSTATRAFLLVSDKIVLTTTTLAYSSSNFTIGVNALDVATGHLLWTQPLLIPWPSLVNCGPFPIALSPDGSTVYGAKVTNQSVWGVFSSSIVAFDSLTGVQRWETPVDDYVFWLATNPDGLHAMSYRQLLSFDLTSGAPRWASNYTQPRASPCSVFSIVSDTLLAITTPSGSGRTNYITLFASDTGERLPRSLALPSFSSSGSYAPLQFTAPDTLAMPYYFDCTLLAWNTTTGEQLYRTSKAVPCGGRQPFLNLMGDSNLLVTNTFSSTSESWFTEYAFSADTGLPLGNWTQPACYPLSIPRPITFNDNASHCNCVSHFGQPIGSWGAYIVCYTEDSKWSCNS